MHRLEIALFGTPRLRFDGEPWPLRVPPSGWPLLALLVAHGPEPIARGTLALSLWPDEDDVEARANLRRHLHRLTHGLPPSVQPWILADTSQVGWNHAAPAQIDVVEFERSIAQNSDREAVEIYSGDLLEASFDEAILEARERLRTQYTDALERLMREARRKRDFTAAIAYAEKLLGADEWSESAVRAILAARYQSGDRAGALAVYERFAQALKNELHVQPMAETSALRDTILTGAMLLEDEDAALETRDGETGVPFVGRAGELQAVRNAWLRAARGRGSAIFIAGEPGIGKSRLALELGATVESQGGRTLIGRTSYPEAGAFQPIIEALREGLSLLAPGDLDDAWQCVLQPLLPEIARLRPNLAESEALDPERARLRLREAFVRLAAAIAARRPIAIVLEDLHWAQRDTLELADALAHRVAGLPIVMVMTYRSDEVGSRHPLQALRRRLQHERRGQTIALARFGEKEIEQLARDLFAPQNIPAGLSAHIHQMSEGNPLFAVQLLRFYKDTGEMPSSQSALHSVGDAVISRVGRLSPEARAIAGVCASIESTFTIDELARVGGWDESSVLDALGILLDAKIVCERGGDRFAYGFTHALIEAAIRDADAAATPATQRRFRRRRIAEVLEDTRALDPAAAALVATHWEAAGEGARAAGAYLRAAQAAMQRYAWSEAVPLARRASELPLEEPERFQALHALIDASYRIGDVPAILPQLDVLEALATKVGTAQRVAATLLRIRCAAVVADRAAERRAIDTLGAIANTTGNDDWRAEAHLARATLHCHDGRFAEAEPELHAALAAARITGSAERIARIRELMVQDLFRQGKVAEGKVLVDAFRKERAETGDLRSLELLATGQIRLAVASEDPEEYRRARELAMQIAKLIGDTRSFILATNELAYGSQLVWDTAGARAGYFEASTLSNDRGFVQYWITSQINLGCVEREVGHLDRAIALWKAVRPIARRHEAVISLTCLAINLAETALAQGRHADALKEAQMGFDMASKTGERRLIAESASIVGAAEIASGRRDAGLAHMLDGVDLRRTLNAPRTLANELCSYAEALLDAKRLDAAAAVAAELRALVGTNPEHQIYPARICLALSRVAAERGDAAEAKALRQLGKRTIDFVLARLTDPEDRAAFAALPHNKLLLAASA